MAESAKERIHVDVAPATVFDVAVDFERYPTWAKDVKQASIVERDTDGHGTRVEFRAAALGKSIRYLLAYDYAEAPDGFSWNLVEGDMLRRLDGSYQFEPDGDGTLVRYELTVDISMPLPGLIKRRAAGLIIGAALKELKKEAERAR